MKTKIAPKSVHQLALSLIQAWRSLMQSPGPSDVLQTREFRLCVSKVLEIQKFRKEGLSFSHLWKDSALFGAYMAYFWPIHYQQARHIFSAKNQRLGNTWILEAGAGAYTVAALESGATNVTAFESHERCRMMVSTFVAKLAHTLNTSNWKFPQTPHIRSETESEADTIILGHSLEIDSNSDQWIKRTVKWIIELTKKLNPSGRLIIVESSDPIRKKALQLLKKELELHLAQTSLRDSGLIETFARPLERTQLMQDIMRSSRRQELKTEFEVWTLQRPGL